MPAHKHYNLVKATLIFVLIFLHCQLLLAERYYVFAGSYNWNKKKTGIYVYELDTISGKLKQICRVSNVLNPAYLAISPDGRNVFACTEAQIPGSGSIGSFSFDAAKGSLTFINEQKSGGENPVYITVHSSGRWLVNANYTGGSVSVYPLAHGGAISHPAQVIPFTDSSVNRKRQEHSHIHAAVFSPDQDFILLPDLGADKIRCYAFDSLSKEPLRPVAYPPTTAMPGSGPRHLVFHPNQRFCYCTEEMSGTVTAYIYLNGKLTVFQRIATHSNRVKTGFSDADIHSSPDGRFLYVSNRGNENNIAIFSVDGKNGKLTSIGYQSVLGDHPRSFAIDPSGKFLLVANQISGDIVVFKRNIETGLLSETWTRIKVPGASCVKIRKYAD